MQSFQFFKWFLPTLIAASLWASIAHAQTPASASSPAQTQTQKASPQKKQASQPAPPAKKEEAQKLNPVVVTATRIPQPIGEIGTTITGVEAPQIAKKKNQLVPDVLRPARGGSVRSS